MHKTFALFAITTTASIAQADTSILTMTISNACFERVYSDAHLSAHPDQQVARIGFGPVAEGEVAPRGTDATFQLFMETRAREDIYTAIAYCIDGPRAECYFAGDKGQFFLSGSQVIGQPGIVLTVGESDLQFTGLVDSTYAISATSGDDREFIIPFKNEGSCHVAF